MCQLDAKSPDSNAVTGKISVAELKQEIDYRVMMNLAEREHVKREYMRGFWDCFYLVAFVAWIVCLYYFGRED